MEIIEKKQNEIHIFKSKAVSTRTLHPNWRKKSLEPLKANH